MTKITNIKRSLPFLESAKHADASFIFEVVARMQTECESTAKQSKAPASKANQSQYCAKQTRDDEKETANVRQSEMKQAARQKDKRKHT